MGHQEKENTYESIVENAKTETKRERERQRVKVKRKRAAYYNFP